MTIHVYIPIHQMCRRAMVPRNPRPKLIPGHHTPYTCRTIITSDLTCNHKLDTGHSHLAWIEPILTQPITNALTEYGHNDHASAAAAPTITTTTTTIIITMTLRTITTITTTTTTPMITATTTTPVIMMRIHHHLF